jgi:hypothetical protein
MERNLRSSRNLLRRSKNIRILLTRSDETLLYMISDVTATGK